jgi:undecaprenyl diphosphate synthase
MSGMGVQIRIVGDREAVSPKLRKAWSEAESATKHNDKLILNVAFNYGGRWDIVQAARRAVSDGVAAQDLTEAVLSGYMAMSGSPDPDLFIRTGGEVRISNFLLWQIAYTEFVFSDCLWPDFGEAQLDAAIAEFRERDRRFGGVKGS